MNYLIFGASRGLGALFSHSLPTAGDMVWLVSRSQPDLADHDGVKRIWIQANLSDKDVASHLADAIGDGTLDVCLYNAGIWEKFAFSNKYDYEQVPADEIDRIITTNLTSAITSIQRLLPALRRSQNGKVILIGSNAGLENSGRPEVAYVVSKFGLRGFAHSLREVVRNSSISVTSLNLGDVGDVRRIDGQFRVDIGASGRLLISPNDIVIMLKAIIALSNTSCIKELDMLAMSDSI